MSTTLRRSVLTLLACFGGFLAGHAHAQATRTWVSGVGDDANPCSRTAPCKTFAGAISKTAAGGEINALDPGGYGTLTITKSITIDGGTGAGWASILNSGTTGLFINAAGATVTLRRLSINGAGGGLNGIRIFSAAQVFVENCEIFDQTGGNPNGRGISDERTTGGQLFVRDTVIRSNSQSGMVIFPASGSTTIDATLRGVHLLGNGNAGLAATYGATVTMTDSTASGNSFGIYVEQPAGTTRVFIADSLLSDNGVGLQLGPGTSAVRMSNVSITNNDNGVVNGGSGTLFSFGNNRVSGNTANNAPVVTPVGPI
jgi:hypothetical protein